MQVVEGLFYPYSENKGADQLRGYHEADLRLCFRICKKPVFSRRGSYDMDMLQGVVVILMELLFFFFFCFAVAICDLMNDVEAINGL